MVGLQKLLKLASLYSLASLFAFAGSAREAIQQLADLKLSMNELIPVGELYQILKDPYVSDEEKSEAITELSELVADIKGNYASSPSAPNISGALDDIFNDATAGLGNLKPAAFNQDVETATEAAGVDVGEQEALSGSGPGGGMSMSEDPEKKKERDREYARSKRHGLSRDEYLQTQREHDKKRMKSIVETRKYNRYIQKIMQERNISREEAKKVLESQLHERLSERATNEGLSSERVSQEGLSKEDVLEKLKALKQEEFTNLKKKPEHDLNTPEGLKAYKNKIRQAQFKARAKAKKMYLAELMGQGHSQMYAEKMVDALSIDELDNLVKKFNLAA